MIFGSVCSGHDAVSQALLPRGWQCAFLAEVEAFPCGVLAHRFGATAPRHHLDPSVLPEKDRKDWVANNKELDRMAKRGVFGTETPNLGDFTKIDPAEWSHVEWLWGGTPCQAFSVAGARKGLKDHRGNLTLAFVGLAHDLAANGSLRGLTWENVPGVLSSKDNAFGCFLGALAGHDAPLISPHGKGRWPDAGVVVGPRCRIAWRILDTQHFGLPQRRRRVFVVASFGDGPDPVGILFERQGLPGASAPGARARERLAGYAAAGAGAGVQGGVTHPRAVAPTLSARTKGGGGLGGDTEVDGGVIPVAYPSQVARTLRAEGFDASEDGTGRGTPLGPMAFGGNNTAGAIDIATALSAHGGPHGRQDFESETFVAMPQVYSAMPMNSGKDFVVREVDVAQPVLAGGPGLGNQGGDYVVQPMAKAFSLRGRDGENQIEPEEGEVAPALRTGEGGSSKSFVATYGIAADALDRTGEGAAGNAAERAGLGIIEEMSPTLKTRANAVADLVRWAVRRLMPTECEALQGTERGFTRIPWRGKPAEQCPDGPRYKVLGNSMSVDVILWLGIQIEVACGRISNHG